MGRLHASARYITVLRPRRLQLMERGACFGICAIIGDQYLAIYATEVRGKSVWKSTLLTGQNGHAAGGATYVQRAVLSQSRWGVKFSRARNAFFHVFCWRAERAGGGGVRWRESPKVHPELAVPLYA